MGDGLGGNYDPEIGDDVPLDADGKSHLYDGYNAKVHGLSGAAQSVGNFAAGFNPIANAITVATGQDASGHCVSRGERVIAALNILPIGSVVRIGERPGGILLNKVGSYYIKSVNPNASKFSQWYGRLTIKNTAKALNKLGDLAPFHVYHNDELRIRDVGEFRGNTVDFLKTWWEGSKRLGTPFNDIKSRNMGATGQIFDPALQPGTWTVPAGAAGAIGWLSYKWHEAL